MEELINDLIFDEFQFESPKINCGGCGVFALAIARYLMKQGHYDFKLIALCKYWDDAIKYSITSNNNIIKTVPSHVVLSLNGFYFDAKGIFFEEVFIQTCNDNCLICLEIDFNEKDLLKSINNVNNWNPRFDRSSWIQKFERVFGVCLDDVKL